jgi:diketogulonate reductase-like aldo/keto reductase
MRVFVRGSATVTFFQGIPFASGMQQRRLGPGPATLSRIGLGTWRVQDRTRTSAALLAGIDAGLTHIDTAELYEQQSRSETMLGKIFTAHPGLRERLLVASKVLPHNASYEGTLAACEATLKRLGTPHVDLYYLHWRGEHPLEDTFDAMAQLVEDGKVRHIGVSNFDVDDLEQAEAILGKGVLAANQVLYQLEDRGAESDVIPWCKAHKVTVVAYSPFGAGAFVADKRRRKALDDAAAKAGLDARQAALAFLTRDPAVVAIPKTEDATHANALAGGSTDLPKDVLAAIDSAFTVKAGLRTI